MINNNNFEIYINNDKYNNVDNYHISDKYND